MKILTKIFISIYLMLEVIKGQCIGDLNTDYRVDQNDLSIFSDYLLSANDTIINNADIDYNNSLDIFDLISIINQITNNDLMWCEFENVDLSVEWEERKFLLLLMMRTLNLYLTMKSITFQILEVIIVIHRGKLLEKIIITIAVLVKILIYGP